MYKVKGKIYLDDSEILHLKELCELNTSQKQIAKVLNVSVCTVRRICKDLHIQTGTIRKKFVNEQYFNKVDSHNKSYWLGFIYADGCIYKNVKTGNYNLTITVSEKDLQLLEEFKKDIQSEHKISKVKPSIFNGRVSKPKVSISISSKKIFESLNKLGVSECKSLKLEIPKIKSEYYSSFIRGYFDGDGSVFSYMDRNSIRYRCNIIGSTNFMKWMKNILPIDVRLYKEPRVTDIYYINVQTKNSLEKFYYYLYSSPGYKLERKYNKYSEFIHSLKRAPETEMVPPTKMGDDTVHSLEKSKVSA
jgi:hypothetical protein